MRPACRLVILLLLACLAGCSSPANEAPAARGAAQPSPYQWVTDLDYALLPEASGLAVSRRVANRLWFVNDQGNPSALIALDVDSLDYRRIMLADQANRDWEDLAAFTLDQQPWLLIADVGDNKAVRGSVALIFVEEPSGDAGFASHRIEFRYPDGARDVEAVAVDVRGDHILLLSKRDEPPVLYRLPLRATLAGARQAQPPVITAERLGVVTSIPAPTALELRLFPTYGEFRSQPTAMDISPDGSEIVVLTYGEAYRAQRGDDQGWLDALNGRLQRLQMPVLAQPETIAYAGRDAIYITSERAGAPLLWRSLRPAGSRP